LAGAVGLVLRLPATEAAEPLETTTVRLNKNPGVCIAPLYFAEKLLRAEGFTDIRYIEIPTVTNEEALASGRRS
jgi:NitT/TauT family transport system substrate-binding protein